MKNHELIFWVEDRPPFMQAFYAAVQHLLSIFVSIITPPLLISSAIGLNHDDTSYMISMSLLVSGICTFIQCKRVGPVGCKLLCVQGTSFSFIGPIIAAGMAGGLPMIFGCCMAAAPIEMLVSVSFYYLRKIITPIVSGIVVTIIGITLIKAGVVSFGGGYDSMAEGAQFGFGCWQNLLVGFTVILTISVLNVCGQKYLRMSSVIIGIVAGYIVAACFGMVHFDFSSSSYVTIPMPFKYGLDFSLSSFISIALVYLVTAIEATGDVTANSVVSGLSIKNGAYRKRVAGGVLADGVNSFLASFFNSFPNSIFAQNNGIIQLTGVASRYVGYFIASLLILLGLFPIIGAALSTMPDPVLGGATLLMFAMVATSGIRVICNCKNIGNDEALIIALSFALGLGVEFCPDILNNSPDFVKNVFASGITTGGLTAIAGQVFINFKNRKSQKS